MINKADPQSPWIIAHRGARVSAPENTRSAFDAALAYPIDGIELDVQMSSDEVPVLFHDKTLAKIYGGLRRVSDFSYAHLKNYDWGSWFSRAYRGEPLLTLEETLQDYAEKTRLLIEIKSRMRDRESGASRTLTLHVLELLRDLVPDRHRGNIFVLSFDPEVLNLAYQKAPEWNYILNLHEPLSDIDKCPTPPDRLAGFCIEIRKLTKDFVDEAHRRDKPVMTYSCNVPIQIRKALELNADVCMTDKPGWLVNYLSARGLR
jgi:glycerophosphoryl diester phosphodiesterase